MMKSLSVVSAGLVSLLAMSARAEKLTVEMLPGEHWWGLANKFGTEMPFDAKSKVEIDLRAGNCCNQCSSFLISDLGREIWCDDPVSARIDQGWIVLESPSAPFELYRCGSTLREAFELGARKHFLPSGKSPDPKFFAELDFDSSSNTVSNVWQRQGQPTVVCLESREHTWESLERMVPDMISAGLLGHAFIRPDAPGAVDGELFVRWAQLQALSPAMRLPAGSGRDLDANARAAVKKAVALRQRYAKYISKLAVASGRSGAPMLRNLEWEFPGKGYAAIRDEFMLGEQILVAPQLKKGAKSRMVILPPGEWKDGNTGAVTVGPAELEVATPLDCLPHFLRRTPRETALAAFRKACCADGQADGDFVLGQATPMEKIRPREGVLPEPARSMEVALARNEHEAVQLFVLPRRDLKSVRVDVSPLTAEKGGAQFPAENVKVAVLGYVDVDRPPRFDIDDVGIHGAVSLGAKSPVRAPDYDGVGWWPDPILDGVQQTDVAKNDVQGFWIDVRASAAQAAGRYRGTVRVSATGVAARELPIVVRVYDFEVPRKTPLPMAITFAPGPSWEKATPDEIALNKRLVADPKSPVNCWKAREQDWYDFLADRYITVDSLYHHGLSEGKVVGLKRLASEGRLDCFNLGYWGYPKELTEAAKAKWREQTLAPLKQTMESVRRAGLEKYAYLYGCDEVKSEFFTNIQWAVSELKREFPGVPLSTTAYDENYGVGTALSGIDWFTPITPMYYPEKAALARKEGRQVWWYICCGPGQPFANMFITHRAIEGRSLMGAQTAKFRPDGFLYYQTTLWNSERPISGTSAFTDWTARSWHTIFGDGSWTCCGEGGKPLSTVRLENFRDGLEDYAYVLALERKLKANPSAPWAEEARKLIAVPDEVVRDLKVYSVDPKVLYAWRSRLAELIEK